MDDFLDILPAHTRKHFLDRRNVMSNREQESYQGGLRNLNADAAAKCLLNSGYFHASSLTIRTAYADAIAIGYVEEALATLELYDVPLTQPM